MKEGLLRSGKCHIFPMRVADKEKTDHFDLLISTQGDRSHYAFIRDLSRLAGAQKNAYDGKVFFCKRCFTTFKTSLKK